MNDNQWLAYQLNRPEQKDGIILAFRREKNIDEAIQVKLKGLVENARYELFYEDYGVCAIYTGKELMNGIDIKIPTKPGSLLINYKVIGN